MSILDGLVRIFVGNPKKTSESVIPYGKDRKDGGHDHRTNKGQDRTPRQREGDEKRRKS